MLLRNNFQDHKIQTLHHVTILGVGTHMIFIVGGLCYEYFGEIDWMDGGKEGRGMGGSQLFPPRKHFQASAAV